MPALTVCCAVLMESPAPKYSCCSCGVGSWAKSGDQVGDGEPCWSLGALLFRLVPVPSLLNTVCDRLSPLESCGEGWPKSSGGPMLTPAPNFPTRYSSN